MEFLVIKHSNSPIEIAGRLIKENGPLITGEILWRTLGYPSAAAFRQAKSKNRLSVRVFRVPNMRGNYAFTSDVAAWLVNLAEEVDDQHI